MSGQSRLVKKERPPALDIDNNDAQVRIQVLIVMHNFKRFLTNIY